MTSDWREEEIDATDGCRVQVITYRIESEDGTEQLTKTIRRKHSEHDSSEKFNANRFVSIML
ncbi:hypothetical protein ANCCEY_14577 [Ancylostoma ceylanicum]|uniref:Uncharacterized protein n=1 Tax=Ancylostoma ceylanicum TaxID=53326 RepID=A0A0D6L9I1_9BILA|nr:hypothetical protein ANCCEY_14577 [Ancylostoma ceylanicum]